MKRINEDEDDSDEDMQRFVIKMKKEDCDQTSFSDKSRNLMAKMGYREGEGLGKESQGRVEPITATDQKGKAWIGEETERLESNEDNWDFGADKLYECEKVDWFSFSGDRPIISHDWIKVAEKKLSLDNEWHFCKPSILKGVLKGKDVFDRVGVCDLRKARSTCNPYEALGKGFFMNRAALKMANMDSKFGFMFTRAHNQQEILHFADVCAGPGGFSEYVLWRSRGACKGYGFTLKGENDFKVGELKAGPSEMFRPHYGVGGLDGNGDVFDSDNQSAFKDFVMSQTMGRGVHFMMADGAFSVEGREKIQEILSHRLYLCQCIQALNCITNGGHFVCSLFDVFTAFSCGLVYLMSLCFSHICIFKPLTSRPANSERYLVCKAKKQNTEEEKQTIDMVLSLMQEANNRMECVFPGNENSEEMVREIVPMEVLKGDLSFDDYITNSNNFIGRLQCIALLKIETFLRNPNLVEGRGGEVTNKCLRDWKIPNIVRTSFTCHFSPQKVFDEIMKGNKMAKCMGTLTMTSLNEEINSRLDHVVFVLSSPTPLIMISEGKGAVHTRRMDGEGLWEKQTNLPSTDIHIDTNLPLGTVLLVEMVAERYCKGQRTHQRYHVMDFLAWSGVSIAHLAFHRRRRYLKMFLQASTQQSLLPVDMIIKPVMKLTDVEKGVFERVEVSTMKTEGPELLIPVLCDDDDRNNNNNHESNCYDNNNDSNNTNNNDRVMQAKSLMLMRTTKMPWMTATSKKTNSNNYFFNTINKRSTFQRPEESYCNYLESTCVAWNLIHRTHPHPQLPSPPPDAEKDAQVVTKNRFLQHIASLP